MAFTFSSKYSNLFSEQVGQGTQLPSRLASNASSMLANTPMKAHQSTPSLHAAGLTSTESMNMNLNLNSTPKLPTLFESSVGT